MPTKEDKMTKLDKPSLLDQFQLGFEYDITWKEAKHAVKARTQR